jgi:hypothetical protein
VLCLVPKLGFDHWVHDKSDCERYFPRLMRFLQHAAELQNCFEILPLAMSNVRSVFLQYFETSRGMDIDIIVPFLCLKMVTSFTGNWISGTSCAWLSPSMSFTTKDLSLDQSVFDHKVMTKFLRCFPSLVCLFYRHGDLPIRPADFEPPKIMEASEYLKPCLKELSILNYTTAINSELRYFPIETLRDFQSSGRSKSQYQP